MTPEQLKASILQYAIQGKLVEQRPEEGTAEELYKQIQAEKQRLIKEGKIKKEKTLPDIAEDEIPFDIPESWKWVNISEMSIFQEGPGILAKDFRESGIPLIRIAGMQSDILSLDGCNYLDEEMVENKWNHFRLDLGDILISTSASMDKICEVDEHTVGAIPYTGQIRFKMLGGVSKQYFKWFIKSPCYKKQIDNQKTGGMIKHYGPTHLRKMYIPIPPLAEQKRIVAKIEELIPYIDRYAAAYERLEQFNAKFPEDMKKSILQCAIQGKLVEQRPEEGTGEELFQQIQKEKHKLIKEGKIKKEKPFSQNPAYQEYPFDIPDSWMFVRFGELLITRDSERIPVAVSDRSKRSKIYDYYGASGVIDKIDNYLFDKELLLIGEDGANLLSRSTPIAFIAKGKYWVNNHAHVLDACCNLNLNYICYYINAISLAPYVTGTAQPKMNQENMNAIWIALPPLAEQKRIVAKLEELLPLCERLK